MLNTTGVFKLISIGSKGTTKNGQSYVVVNAVNFFDQSTVEERENGAKDRFYSLKAFGSTADFIIKNFKPEAGTRRAMVTGTLELQDYTTQMEVSKIVKVDGKKVRVKFNVDVDKVKAGVVINDIRLLDKPNMKADDEVEAEVVDDEDDVVEAEVVDDDNDAPAGEHTNVVAEEKKKGKRKKKALPKTLPADDEDDSSIE